MGAYLNKRKGELLLMLLTAWAVCEVTLNGFHLDSLVAEHGYWFRALIALGCVAVLLAVLMLCAYQPRKRARAAACYIAAAAVLLAAAFALSTGEQPYADEEGNYLFLALDAAVVSLACFALTRTQAGCMAWFVVASCCCSMTQAFFQAGDLCMSMVGVASALALVVYRNFTSGVRSAQAARAGAGSLAFATALIPVLAAGAAALALWFLVIAPLGPGTLSIKLFTDYKQLPIEEYVGTADERPQLNYDMSSRDTVDGDPYTTDDLREDQTSETVIDAASALQQQLMASQAGSGAGSSAGGGSRQDYSADAQSQVYNPISYDTDFPWAAVYLAALLVIAVLALAYFIGRRLWRQHRLRRMLALPPRESVKQLYRFILGRLERIGFTQPEGMSLREFAQCSQRQMDLMTEHTRVPFALLTEAYMRVDYGGEEPSEDDLVMFAAYYLRFWKAARQQLGNLKYFFTSFRL